MKPSEVLAKAADLIEPEGAWTQNALARNAAGRDAEVRASDAVCWCVLGAIIRVRDNDHAGHKRSAHDYLALKVGRSVVDFNNAPERKQAEVVKALRDAADLARSEGQ